MNDSHSWHGKQAFFNKNAFQHDLVTKVNKIGKVAVLIYIDRTENKYDTSLMDKLKSNVSSLYLKVCAAYFVVYCVFDANYVDSMELIYSMNMNEIKWPEYRYIMNYKVLMSMALKLTFNMQRLFRFSDKSIRSSVLTFRTYPQCSYWSIPCRVHSQMHMFALP